MKKKTLGEMLYEVENLMKTAVGLNQKLDLDGVDALEVEMKLQAFADSEGNTSLTVTCDIFTFVIKSQSFEGLLAGALKTANDAVVQATEEVRTRPAQPYAGLRLVHSA